MLITYLSYMFHHTYSRPGLGLGLALTADGVRVRNDKPGRDLQTISNQFYLIRLYNAKLPVYYYIHFNIQNEFFQVSTLYV